MNNNKVKLHYKNCLSCHGSTNAVHSPPLPVGIFRGGRVGEVEGASWMQQTSCLRTIQFHECIKWECTWGRRCTEDTCMHWVYLTFMLEMVHGVRARLHHSMRTTADTMHGVWCVANIMLSHLYYGMWVWGRECWWWWLRRIHVPCILHAQTAF